MGAVRGGRRGAGSRAGGECVALLVLLGAALAAVPAGAQEPAPPDGEARGPEVEDVRFPGAERLDRQLLEDAIVTRETECRSGWLWLVCEVTDFDFAERKAYLDPAELERDRARLEEKRLNSTAEHSAEKAAQYASHVKELEERLQVLERIVTDRGYDIAAQIEALRDTRRVESGRAARNMETSN